jgi:hypothetical protein
MHISFGPARALDDGVWTGTLSETEARRLPGAPLRSRGPHVVQLTAPAWNGAELRAPFDGVSVVALGAGERAIFLATASAAPASGPPSAAKAPPANPAPPAPAPLAAPAPTATDAAATNDDAAFVAECAQLGSEMERVARALIARIRATHEGALKRQTNPRLFVETPDNFWSVEIQPRTGAIKLVVRTDEYALLRAGLPVHSERPPSYWMMKVYGYGYIEEALRFVAVGKPPQKDA